MNSFSTIHKSIIYLLFFFFYHSVCAQNFPHEFGKYSNEEFQLTKYDKDPSAEAVVIYDIGESFFVNNDNGFEIIFERKLKIKVFNKAGLKWAQFEIPYYLGDNGYEKVYDIEGNTYNFENGVIRKTSLNIQNVYEEKKDEHWVYKKFAMPDVKEGSIIEICYKINTPYVFNFRSWEFQLEIPVIYSEYKTKMIPFYTYSYILQGADKFDTFNSGVDPGFPRKFAGVSYQEMNYEFIMRDIPAFKNEGFITSVNDYIIKLDFQLSELHRLNGSVEKIMTTWPKAVEEYLDHENFGKYLKGSIKSGKTIADTMNTFSRTTRQKVEIIDRYVKSNYNWNGQKSDYASKTLKDFIKTKSGNSADLNLYLAGLLQSIGVEAYPVIISTRDHGKIRVDYPFLHYFNYVITIAKVDNEFVLLDATESLCNFGEIPTRCMNDIGLIINKSKVDWLTFNNSLTSAVLDSISLKFNTSMDSLNASFNISTTGYDALNLRKRWFGNDKNKIKEELYLKSLPLEDSMKVNNLTAIDKPFEVIFKSNVYIEKVDNKLLVSPFCAAVITENPFKQLTRTYDIDMIYKKKRSYVVMLHVPEGYKIIKKPDNWNLDNVLVEALYSVEQINATTVKITGHYGFKKGKYEAADYGYLKSIYNKIIDRFNDKIVLAKK